MHLHKGVQLESVFYCHAFFGVSKGPIWSLQGTLSKTNVYTIAKEIVKNQYFILFEPNFTHNSTRPGARAQLCL